MLAVAALMTGAACRSGDAESQAPATVQAPAVADPGAAAPGGRVATEAAVFDYGTVVAGEPVKHTFTIKNSGDGVLNILSARGG
jgi:hypothetical protein